MFGGVRHTHATLVHDVAWCGVLLVAWLCAHRRSMVEPMLRKFEKKDAAAMISNYQDGGKQPSALSTL